MKLHTLKPAKGSVTAKKRIARGEGNGTGGTATKGHKGAKARTGYKSKRAHEGGQMPLQMRIPKRGFKNINRVEYVAVNLSRLETIAEKHGITVFDLDAMVLHGIVRSTDKVKILGGGELTKVLTVKAHAVSEAAKQTIEKLGGTVHTA
jgi:large subunit ribosomal protein L15